MYMYIIMMMMILRFISTYNGYGHPSYTSSFITHLKAYIDEM